MSADSPTLTVKFDADRTGTVVSPDGKFATVTAPFASPPGSTVRGRIEGVSCPLEVKVRGCRRQGPEEPALFVIEGRLQNATREMLAALRGV